MNMTTKNIEPNAEVASMDLISSNSDTSSKRREAMELAMQIENLFKTDRKKFLGFIRQRVRSQEEAEDILQDVFTNVLAASANVQKPIENIASWVFTAVRNRIIDSYRKKRAETFSEMKTPSQNEENGDAFENFLGDYSTSPEGELIRKTIWESEIGRASCRERV